jgi:integral membrane protein (TIGR01906 family)
MRFVSRFAAICFVVAVPVFLVTANVRFVASDVRFYENGFRQYNAAQVTGVALPELDRSAQDIVNYFENDVPTLRIVVNQSGDETSLFNANETAHMKDVKRVMQVVFRMNEVSLVIMLAYISAVVLWARERSPRQLARLALWGIGLMVAFVGFISIFAVTGFDAAWTRFHEIVFPGGNWQFNPDTDHLVQMFPDGFWQGTTYFVAMLTAAEALVVSAIAAAYLILAPNAKPSGPQAVEEEIAGVEQPA